VLSFGEDFGRDHSRFAVDVVYLFSLLAPRDPTLPFGGGFGEDHTMFAADVVSALYLKTLNQGGRLLVPRALMEGTDASDLLKHLKSGLGRGLVADEVRSSRIILINLLISLVDKAKNIDLSDDV
jgi:hypothetical protein